MSPEEELKQIAEMLDTIGIPRKNIIGFNLSVSSRIEELIFSRPTLLAADGAVQHANWCDSRNGYMCDCGRSRNRTTAKA